MAKFNVYTDEGFAKFLDYSKKLAAAYFHRQYESFGSIQDIMKDLIRLPIRPNPMMNTTAAGAMDSVRVVSYRYSKVSDDITVSVIYDIQKDDVRLFVSHLAATPELTPSSEVSLTFKCAVNNSAERCKLEKLNSMNEQAQKEDS